MSQTDVVAGDPTTPMALVDAAERSVIEKRTGSDLFVEAGAGSGKTHALVSRICRLVLHDDVPLGGVAAITFTEKAAAELRERVRSRLSAYDSGDTEVERRRVEALGAVDAAPIGTVHSFAARIVSEFPLAAGVPPRITVVAALGSRLGAAARWERVRARLFSGGEADRDLVTAVEALLAAGVSVDRFRRLAEELDKQWDRLPTAAPSPMPSSPELSGVISAADRFLESLDDCTDRSDKFAIRFAEVHTWRDRLAASVHPPGAAAAPDLAWLEIARSCPGVGSGGAGKNWIGGAAQVREMKSELKALKAEGADAAARYTARAVGVVVAHIADVLRACARERRRSGQLEFHDLLVTARRVLDDDDVRRRLHDRYPRILLDEFQDTDPLQWEIAQKIADGAAGHLFTVGDPKQSIYRFRRADIGTYMAVRDRHEDARVGGPDAGGDEAGGGIVALHTNFRSTWPVIDWVNTVFETAIVPQPYVQPGYAALSAAPDRGSPVDPRTPAPFVFATPPPRKDAGDTPSPDPVASAPAEALRAHEARDVARVVATAVGQGWRTRPRGEEAGAAIGLKDICVLIPSRTCLPYIEDALDDARIDFRAEASSLVYVTTEVHELLVTVRALSDPADEAVLVAALRTSLFGCGDDDLLRWRNAGGRWHMHSPIPEGLEESPVAEAIGYLRGLWTRSWELAPAEVLTRLIDERRIFEVAVDSPRYRDTWRRLRFIVDQARAWHESDRGDLRAYVDWARMQQGEDARVTEAVLPEVGVEAVRIMTVHAAKGLQFPMVIVAGMSGGFRTDHPAVLWSGDGRPAVSMTVDARTPEYEDAKATHDAHQKAERIRLLYVACTRAESVLAVSGHRPSNGASWGALIDDGIAAADGPQPDLVETAAMEASPGSDVTPPPDHAEWVHERRRVSATSRLVSVVSATDIGHAPDEGRAAEVRAAYGDAGLVPAAIGDERVPGSSGMAGHGTAYGMALHGLLEAVDLGSGLDEQWARDLAATAEIDDADGFVALARSILAAEPVARAATRECWKEMPLVGPAPRAQAGSGGAPAPTYDTLVEGVADLVYREDDGTLVVVDYKTDLGVAAATLEGYWTQLAVYAELLREAAGEDVSALVLVFARPGSAHVLSRSYRAR